MNTEIIVAIITATALITSTLVTAIFKYLEFRKNKEKNKPDSLELTQNKLFEKELFSKSEYWVTYTIKRLGFSNGNREWIYETIMKNKIITASKRTKEFLENNDLVLMNDVKFENAIFLLISQIVDEYNTTILDDFKNKFGKSKGDKIFNLVMNKEATKESQSIGFNVWHAPTITYMAKSIKDHCDAYYPNNVYKMNAIIDEFKTSLSTAHSHLYKTFQNFNGELDCLIKEQ